MKTIFKTTILASLLSLAVISCNDNDSNEDVQALETQEVALSEDNFSLRPGAFDVETLSDSQLRSLSARIRARILEIFNQRIDAENNSQIRREIRLTERDIELETLQLEVLLERRTRPGEVRSLINTLIEASRTNIRRDREILREIRNL